MGRSKDIASGSKFVDTTGDTMTGNLGIGVAPSTSPLHVVGSSSGGFLGGGIRINDTNHSSDFFIGGGGTGSLQIASAAGATRMVIDSSGRVTMPSNPVFQAYNLSSGSSNTNQVFPNTRINEGNHYSTSTGRFTAPVAGKYLFGFGSIANSANGTYRYYIRKNGSNIGTGHHLRVDTNETGSAYGTNATYTFPLALAASDYVNVFFIESNNGTATEGGDYAIFWGYLIG